MRDDEHEGAWAREEFGRAELGDGRRTARLVQMARRAAQRPGGRISQVFDLPAERQGAYDFVEGQGIAVEEMARSIGEASARRAAEESYAVVAVDSTSLSLLESVQDVSDLKGFGPVGAASLGVRGLHVMSALAISPAGVPLGLAAMRWWVRPPSALKLTRSELELRPMKDTELNYWATTIEDVRQRFREHAPGVGVWFQLDRGGDAWRLLRFLRDGNYTYTVRGRSDRSVGDYGGARRTDQRAKKALRRAAIRTEIRVSLPARLHRQPRTARLLVHAGSITLRLRDPAAWKPELAPVIGVWVREVGTPRGEVPIEWLLWTNHVVTNADAAKTVAKNYAMRWRIEEFHKTWKTGACNIESLQLRSVSAATRWATLLATVAARIERMKYLARTLPESPASDELTAREIEALVLLKRGSKTSAELIPDAPTIGQAVGWLADLGGYVRLNSSRPPGSIVIARGLAQLSPAARLLDYLYSADKLR